MERFSSIFDNPATNLGARKKRRLERAAADKKARLGQDFMVGFNDIKDGDGITVPWGPNQQPQELRFTTGQEGRTFDSFERDGPDKTPQWFNTPYNIQKMRKQRYALSQQLGVDPDLVTNEMVFAEGEKQAAGLFEDIKQASGNKAEDSFFPGEEPRYPVNIQGGQEEGLYGRPLVRPYGADGTDLVEKANTPRRNAAFNTFYNRNARADAIAPQVEAEQLAARERKAAGGVSDIDVTGTGGFIKNLKNTLVNSTKEIAQNLANAPLTGTQSAVDRQLSGEEAKAFLTRRQKEKASKNIYKDLLGATTPKNIKKLTKEAAKFALTPKEKQLDKPRAKKSYNEAVVRRRLAKKGKTKEEIQAFIDKLDLNDKYIEDNKNPTASKGKVTPNDEFIPYKETKKVTEGSIAKSIKRTRDAIKEDRKKNNGLYTKIFQESAEKTPDTIKDTLDAVKILSAPMSESSIKDKVAAATKLSLSPFTIAANTIKLLTEAPKGALTVAVESAPYTALAAGKGPLGALAKTASFMSMQEMAYRQGIEDFTREKGKAPNSEEKAFMRNLSGLYAAAELIGDIAVIGIAKSAFKKKPPTRRQEAKARLKDRRAKAAGKPTRAEKQINAIDKKVTRNLNRSKKAKVAIGTVKLTAKAAALALKNPVTKSALTEYVQEGTQSFLEGAMVNQNLTDIDTRKVSTGAIQGAAAGPTTLAGILAGKTAIGAGKRLAKADYSTLSREEFQNRARNFGDRAKSGAKAAAQSKASIETVSDPSNRLYDYDIASTKIERALINATTQEDIDKLTQQNKDLEKTETTRIGKEFQDKEVIPGTAAHSKAVEELISQADTIAARTAEIQEVADKYGTTVPTREQFAEDREARLASQDALKKGATEEQQKAAGEAARTAFKDKNLVSASTADKVTAIFDVLSGTGNEDFFIDDDQLTDSANPKSFDGILKSVYENISESLKALASKGDLGVGKTATQVRKEILGNGLNTQGQKGAGAYIRSLAGALKQAETDVDRLGYAELIRNRLANFLEFRVKRRNAIKDGVDGGKVALGTSIFYDLASGGRGSFKNTAATAKFIENVMDPEITILEESLRLADAMLVDAFEKAGKDPEVDSIFAKQKAAAEKQKAEKEAEEKRKATANDKDAEVRDTDTKSTAALEKSNAPADKEEAARRKNNPVTAETSIGTVVARHSKTTGKTQYYKIIKPSAFVKNNPGKVSIVSVDVNGKEPSGTNRRQPADMVNLYINNGPAETATDEEVVDDDETTPPPTPPPSPTDDPEGLAKYNATGIEGIDPTLGEDTLKPLTKLNTVDLENSKNSIDIEIAKDRRDAKLKNDTPLGTVVASHKTNEYFTLFEISPESATVEVEVQRTDKQIADPDLTVEKKTISKNELYIPGEAKKRYPEAGEVTSMAVLFDEKDSQLPVFMLGVHRLLSLSAEEFKFIAASTLARYTMDSNLGNLVKISTEEGKAYYKSLQQRVIDNFKSSKDNEDLLDELDETEEEQEEENEEDEYRDSTTLNDVANQEVSNTVSTNLDTLFNNNYEDSRIDVSSRVKTSKTTSQKLKALSRVINTFFNRMEVGETTAEEELLANTYINTSLIISDFLKALKKGEFESKSSKVRAAKKALKEAEKAFAPVFRIKESVKDNITTLAKDQLNIDGSNALVRSLNIFMEMEILDNAQSVNREKTLKEITKEMEEFNSPNYSDLNNTSNKINDMMVSFYIRYDVFPTPKEITTTGAQVLTEEEEADKNVPDIRTDLKYGKATSFFGLIPNLLVSLRSSRITDALSKHFPMMEQINVSERLELVFDLYANVVDSYKALIKDTLDTKGIKQDSLVGFRTKVEEIGQIHELPDNVLQMVSVSLFKFLATEAKSTISINEADTKSLLGIDKRNIFTGTDKAIISAQLGDKGLLSANFARRYGKEILNALSIYADPTKDDSVYQTLQLSLGNLMLNMGVHLDLLEINPISIETLNKLRNNIESREEAYIGVDDQLWKGIGTVDFVRAKSEIYLPYNDTNNEGQDEYAEEYLYEQEGEEQEIPVGFIRDVIHDYHGTYNKDGKGSKDIIKAIANIEDPEKMPEKEPIKKVNDSIKGTMSKLTQKAKDAFAAVQTSALALDPNMASLFNNLNPDTLSRLLDENFKKTGVYVGREKRVEAQSEDKQRQIYYLKKYIAERERTANEDKGEKNTPPFLRKMYLVYKGFKNGRNGQTGILRPQDYVIHRFAVTSKGSARKVDLTNSSHVMATKSVIMAGFGHGLDKTGIERIIPIFDEKVMSPDGTLIGAYAKIAEVLKKVKNDEALTSDESTSLLENMDTIKGEPTHKLAAIFSLMAFSDAVKSPTRNDFQLTLGKEIDGVTNGVIQAMLQMGVDVKIMKRVLEAGGVYLDGSYDGFVNFYKDGKNLDNYQQLASNMLDEMMAERATLEEKVASPDSTEAELDEAQEKIQLIDAVSKLYVDIGKEDKDEKLQVTPEGRELAKDPLMLIVYGAGIKSITRAQSVMGLDSLYKKIEDEVAIAINTKNSSNIEQLMLNINTAVRFSSRAGSINEVFDERDIRKYTADPSFLLQHEFTRDQETSYKMAVQDVYGSATEKAISKFFGALLRHRDAVNAAVNVMSLTASLIYKQKADEYKLEYDVSMLTREASDSILLEMQKIGAIAGVAHAYSKSARPAAIKDGLIDYTDHIEVMSNNYAAVKDKTAIQSTAFKPGVFKVNSIGIDNETKLIKEDPSGTKTTTISSHKTQLQSFSINELEGPRSFVLINQFGDGNVQIVSMAADGSIIQIHDAIIHNPLVQVSGQKNAPITNKTMYENNRDYNLFDELKKRLDTTQALMDEYGIRGKVDAYLGGNKRALTLHPENTEGLDAEQETFGSIKDFMSAFSTIHKTVTANKNEYFSTINVFDNFTSDGLSSYKVPKNGTSIADHPEYPEELLKDAAYIEKVKEDVDEKAENEVVSKTFANYVSDLLQIINDNNIQLENNDKFTVERFGTGLGLIRRVMLEGDKSSGNQAINTGFTVVRTGSNYRLMDGENLVISKGYPSITKLLIATNEMLLPQNAAVFERLEQVRKEEEEANKNLKGPGTGSEASPIHNFFPVFNINFGANTVNELYDRVSSISLDLGNKQDSPEFSEYIEKFIKEFITPLYEESEAVVGPMVNVGRSPSNRAKGFTTESGENVYVAGAESTLRSDMDMSMEETLGHELLHPIVNYMLDAVPAIRTEALRLFTAAKSEVTWEHFLLRDGDGNIMYSHSQAVDEKIAQDRYKYIFKNGKTGLKEFVVIALTNQRFISTVARLDSRLPLLKITGEGFISGAIALFRNIGISIRNAKLKRQGNTNIHAALTDMVRGMNKVQQSHNTLVFKTWQKLDPINKWGKKVIVDYPWKWYGQYSDYAKGLPDRSRLRKAIDTAITAPYRYTTVPESRQKLNELAYAFKLTRDNALYSLIAEIKGNNPKVLKMQNILSIAKKDQDSARERAASGTTNDVSNSFTPGTPINTFGWRALTALFLKTNIISLLDSYSMDQVYDLMYDTTYKQAEEAKIITKIQRYAGHNSTYVTNQALLLGIKMSTGNLIRAHVMKNGYNIANMFTVNDARIYDSKNLKKLELEIEKLATLYALDYVDPNKKELGKKIHEQEIARTDMAREQVNGIEYMLGIHKGISESARDTLFTNDSISFGSGYTYEMNNEYRDYRLGTKADAIEMEKQAYMPMGEIRLDGNNAFVGKYIIYVSNVKHVNDTVTGISSSSDKKAEGIALKDIYYLLNKGKSTVYMQEILQRALASQRVLNETDVENLQKRLMPKPNLNDINEGKLKSFMAPIIDPVTKNIQTYAYVFNEEEKLKYFAKKDEAPQILGRMEGQLIDKPASLINNVKLFEALNEDWKNREQGTENEYMTIGPNVADDELREFWNLLPEQSKEDARNINGKDEIKIHDSILRISFGFRKFSAADALQGTGVVPYEMYLVLKHAGILWQAVVAKQKRNTVLFTPTVVINNILSNVKIGMMVGVPPDYMVRKSIEGAKLVVSFMANVKEKETLIRELRTEKRSQVVRRKEARVALLQEEIIRSPINYLMEQGLFQNIMEDIREDGGDLTKAVQNLNPWLDQNLDMFDTLVPKGAKRVYDEVTIAPNTDLNKVITNIVQFSDFSARYALFSYLTQEDVVDPDGNKWTKEKAKNKARDTYVDYEVPTSREMQYLNDMGILQYTKFMFRIVRVLHSNAKEAPASMILAEVFRRMFFDFPDIIDSVPTPGVIWNHVTNPADIVDQAFNANLFNQVGYFTEPLSAF